MTGPQTIRWRAASTQEQPGWVRPGALVAMTRGGAGRCPCCGRGVLFTGWLRPRAICSDCAAPLGQVRADDAPPYFVVFITAHVVIALAVALEAAHPLPVMVETPLFVLLALALCLGLLRPVKGATIGLMLQLGLVDASRA